MLSFLKFDSTICACMGTGFIQIDKNFRMPEGSTASVANGYSGGRVPNRLTRDHFHGTQRLGLELHGGLLETGTGVRVWSWSLVSGPWCWIVGCLGEIGDGRFEGV